MERIGMPQDTLLLIKDWTIRLIDESINKRFLTANEETNQIGAGIHANEVTFKAGSVIDVMYPMAEGTKYVLRTCSGARFIVTQQQKEMARSYPDAEYPQVLSGIVKNKLS